MHRKSPSSNVLPMRGGSDALPIRWRVHTAGGRSIPWTSQSRIFSAVVLRGAVLTSSRNFRVSRGAIAFLSPRTSGGAWARLAVTVVAGFINAGWSWALISRGRPDSLDHCPRRREGRQSVHGRSDSSVGVLGGVGIAGYFTLAVLASALAAAVCLNILWFPAGGLMRGRFSGLWMKPSHQR